MLTCSGIILALDLFGGLIENCSLYGDFFGTLDTHKICQILIGCKYNKEDIKTAFKKTDIDNALYNINLHDLIDVLI